MSATCHGDSSSFALSGRRRADTVISLPMFPRLCCAVLLLWVPAAAAAPRTFTIDAAESSATAHVGKTGIASFAGHEHNILAQTIQGEVLLDLEDISRSSVDLIVSARTLKVSEQGEPAGDAPQVEKAMRGPDVLDVARHGIIHFASTGVSGKQTAPGVWDLTLLGELSLHGVAKTFKVPIRLELGGDKLTVVGRMIVKLTEFGIEPTSAAGGLVKVENDVQVVFRIAAKAGQP